MGFVESISDERLVALHAYWSLKRGSRRMPSRSDVDPSDLRPILPYIMLFDVIDGGRDFRYRLVGTEIERHLRQPVSGRLVGETLSGEYRAYILSLHRRALAEKAAVYAENTYDEERSGFAIVASYKRAYRLMLPLSKDGMSVDMMLCGQVFETNPPHAGPEILLVDTGAGRPLA